MKDDEDTEGNVIPFPEPAPLLDGEHTCDGWTSLLRPPTYDLNDRGDFLAYMAAEAHIALKIQGLFGVEEANAWVQFHRGINQPVEEDELKEDGDE